MLPSPYASITVTGNIRPRIFVSIASYRDSECQYTVRDLFGKATYPERVFVGICWQYDAREDADCFIVPPTYPSQVKIAKVDARDSRGVCWARSLTQTLWNGEEYVLQIDSHMRFEPGWDELLIKMLAACPSEKAVLSCYPPGYTQPDVLNRESICTMKAQRFDDDGILRTGGRNISVKDAPGEPILGAFCAAGFLFGKASIIHDVPYDPYLYFYGEENTLTVRLWTHGYDIYHPNKLVIYHLYKTGGVERKKTHFADHQNWADINARSLKRARHVLDAELSSDPQVTKDIEKYGLGKARTLAQYQAWSGVDFKRCTLSEQAVSGKPYPLAA